MYESTVSCVSVNAISSAGQNLPQPRMKALVREAGQVSVQLMPRPKVDADSVLIRVTLAGLCRTDLYAAEGRMKVCDPLVLGHEFSGVIEDVGSEVDALKCGQRVTVNPLLPCRDCRYCLSGAADSCQKTTFLGVDRTGCFAQYICVPASAVFPLTDGVGDLAAAYAEPVAASLAVLKAGISARDNVLIYGKNRFSQLLEKILSVHGISNVTIYDGGGAVEPDSFDCVVETMMQGETISELAKAVRPGGKIVLKSRQFDPVPLRMTDLLKKEPVMHVVNYGSFEEALELLTQGKIVVEDLVDGIYKLEDFRHVMAAARNKEALKPFFAPWDE
jgi:L-iditol 2-dehydrogenase